jgi:hypothetical protein
MTGIRSFRDLDAWKKAILLSAEPLARVINDVGRLLMALVHALEKPIQQQ